MKILFYQTTCPHHFTIHSLETEAVGGTESSLLRIAHAFAEKSHTVYIATHHISVNQEIEGVHYITLDTAHQLKKLDYAVLLQDMYGLEQFASIFKTTKKFFWMHNIPSKFLYRYKTLFLRERFELIGVSEFHAARIQKRVEGGMMNKIKSFVGRNNKVPVHCIYNSISKDFKPIASVVDINKLISMSAPNKGIEMTLQMFERLKKHLPLLQLHIARPWVSLIGSLPEGVTFLGALPQPELRKQVSESLCVFYPQWKRVETFGLVYAEANALGTPFLAHDFGAAREVLSNQEQLVDGQNEEALLQKIKSWQVSRPKVWLKDEFKIENVVRAWEKLLK